MNEMNIDLVELFKEFLCELAISFNSTFAGSVSLLMINHLIDVLGTEE